MFANFLVKSSGTQKGDTGIIYAIHFLMKRKNHKFSVEFYLIKRTCRWVIKLLIGKLSTSIFLYKSAVKILHILVFNFFTMYIFKFVSIDFICFLVVRLLVSETYYNHYMKIFSVWRIAGSVFINNVLIL